MLNQVGFVAARRPVLAVARSKARWSPSVCFSSIAGNDRVSPPPDKLRNVGILAHIDAGKTTVTERMLFYSGELSSVGEVHDGDTMMDFMDQERERGITINSAATTFRWNKHTMNLIDTPGHVDFTVEVERAVRALDGAVALFDAVAGVQAQTETVWRQASRYGVPRIGYVNKMDRPGASFERTAKVIAQRFGTEVLPVQLPVHDSNGNFKGVIDVITQELFVFDQEDKLTTTFEEVPLYKAANLGLDVDVVQVMAARAELLDRLAGLDIEFGELYLDAMIEDPNLGSPMKAFPNDVVRAAIRRATLNQHESKAMPLLCGSALKNTAVQPLMDAIIHYLPNPIEAEELKQRQRDEELALIKSLSGPEAPAEEVSGDAGAEKGEKKKGKAKKSKSKNKNKSKSQAEAVPKDLSNAATALVFKVQNDPQRGPLCFVRVYKGQFDAKKSYYNLSAVNKKGKPAQERAQQLLRAYANEYDMLDSISEGDIAIITGLKQARTGDTICSDPNGEQLMGVQIPPPVFTASIEIDSPSEEAKLNDALAILTRDDPSLTVNNDEETGQLLLSGMGELHLEVSLTKLQRDFGIDCEFSRVRVAYRETLSSETEGTGSFTPRVGASEDDSVAADGATVTIRILPHPAGVDTPITFANDDFSSENGMSFEVPGGGPESAWELSPEQETGVKSGILSALNRGPLLGYPMLGVEVEVLSTKSFAPPSASLDTLRAAGSLAVKRALESQNVAPQLLEPKAKLLISCPDDHIGSVIGELTGSRRALVEDVSPEGSLFDGDQLSRSQITATVPLEGVLGYSTALRSLTSGDATFSIQVDGYVPLSQQQLDKILFPSN